MKYSGLKQLLPIWLHALVLVAMPVIAQQDPNDALDDVFDDAFSDFDDSFATDEGRLQWSGFAELAYGRRISRDPLFTSRQTLGDLRARVETDWSNDAVRLNFRADLHYDDMESGLDTDIRELNAQLSPGSSVDLKMGRQVLTWGTGDLLFLNDLFPKSWVSFFSGRDDEYLKAPSDAVRLTWYTDAVNIDLAWSPEFEPDDYLTGARFSFFAPLAATIVAPQPPLAAVAPDDGFDNGELALRLFRTTGSTEYAAYLYRGYYKRPLGLSAVFEPVFPSLSVYGASVRRPLAGGLFNAEFAFHDSREESRGINPLIPNDQFRFLVGYEFEAATRLTIGLQYYLESTRNYGRLLQNSFAPQFEADRTRHVLTNRLTYRSRQDRLLLSLFTFYSPSDNDHHLRPSVTYRHSDRWTFTGGANLFSGKQEHTFFGQLEDNSNAWLRIRYNY